MENKARVPSNVHEGYLCDYFTGMHRVAPDKAMKEIINIEDWATEAQKELQRRVTSQVLAVLDSETLAAVAAGQADIRAMAANVMDGDSTYQAPPAAI